MIYKKERISSGGLPRPYPVTQGDGPPLPHQETSAQAAEQPAPAAVANAPDSGEAAASEAFVARLMAEEAAMRQTRPDFSLAAAIEESPALRALVSVGEPLERALRYAEMDDLLAGAARTAEDDVLRRIAERRLRPAPIAPAGGGSTSPDIARMSEGELRAIDERLKRGERVSLA